MLLNVSRMFDYVTESNHNLHQVIDSSSGKPFGISAWSLSNFGDYDQCLNIAFQKDASSTQMIMGKHCEVEMKYEMQHTERGSEFIDKFLGFLPLFGYYNHIFTICLPSTCTDNDFVAIASHSKSC